MNEQLPSERLLAPEYTSEQMMQRWFRRAAKPTESNRGSYLWAVVSEVFGVGSTVAISQCEKYGHSPHMRVRKTWGRI